MEQIIIGLTGVTAIFLTQSTKQEFRKYAPIFGLIGQPFWFYSAYTSEQWGIFVLCIFYTFAWAKGIFNFWIKK